MKLLLLSGLIAIMATIAMSNEGLWGQRVPGDKLIYGQNITLPKKIARVQEETVNYNPWFIKPFITAIVVKNYRKKEEPDIKLLKGGVGQKSAEILFTTQESKGMRVEVLIYGKK